MQKLYPFKSPTEVEEQDAVDALIYRDGILDYDAHDALLRERGYAYLALPCTCNGSDDDGHLPCCGWGKRADIHKLNANPPISDGFTDQRDEEEAYQEYCDRAAGRA